MSAQSRIVLITGASGNLGGKLRRHLEGRFPLRLIDRVTAGDSTILQADLSIWSESWVQAFEGVDTVVHLAADPKADQDWPRLVAPNIDATANVFQAAALGKVRRLVFASSNHVMGGYKDLPEPERIGTELPPLPGTSYTVDGKTLSSAAYAATKLFGERLGKMYAESTGLSVIAVRLGWNKPGANRAGDIPVQRWPWFRMMWLSNRDYCRLMERCVLADPELRFAIVNGMSRNTGMRWDLESAQRLLGYEPVDDVVDSSE